jgi:hypothetical protein
VLKQTQQDHWIVRAVRGERLRLENDLRKTEHEISRLATEVRDFRNGVKPSPPLNKTAARARAQDITKRWRAGATLKQIGNEVGLSIERVRQLVYRTECEEYRALTADPFLPLPKNSDIIYGQEYEFAAEDPQTPIVRIPRGTQTSRNRYIRYEKA